VFVLSYAKHGFQFEAKKCTVCLKKRHCLACYKFDKHQTILISFGRNVTKKEKQSNNPYP